MMLMGLWFAIGLAGGGLTGNLMKRLGYGSHWGIWLDILIGAAGAALGGVIIRSSAFIDDGGKIYSLLVALAVAVFLTALNAFVGGRRHYA